MGIKFDIITHHFMLEFVDSDLYFVQDKNNFINPLLQVGSGSVEKSTGSGSGGPKITGSSSLVTTTNVHLLPWLYSKQQQPTWLGKLANPT